MYHVSGAEQFKSFILRVPCSSITPKHVLKIDQINEIFPYKFKECCISQLIKESAFKFYNDSVCCKSQLEKLTSEFQELAFPTYPLIRLLA